MIYRIGHGWTIPDNAGAYEQLLRNEMLPGLGRHDRYCGAFLLRRLIQEREEEVEFITLTLFESMRAVSVFSVNGSRGAVIPDSARALLSRFDRESDHYEILAVPEDPPSS